MKCINQARKVCENVLGSLILPLSTIFLLDLVQYFLFIIHRLFLMVHIQAVERYQYKKKYIRSACLYLISSVVFEPTLKKLLIAKVHLTFGGQRSIIHFYQCLRFQERTLKWFSGVVKFQNLMIFLTIIWQIIGYQYNVLKHLLATTIY
jgi:hypothetical protein